MQTNIRAEILDAARKTGRFHVGTARALEIIEDDGGPVIEHEEFRFAGEFDAVVQGDVMQLVGRWNHHNIFGTQLKVKYGIQTIGSELKDIAYFFQRAGFEGKDIEELCKCGRALVRKWLRVGNVDGRPMGIEPDTAKAMLAAYRQTTGLAESFFWLLEQENLLPRQIERILHTLDWRAKSILTRDPYELVAHGWTFEATDQVALALGAEPEDDARLCGAALAAIYAEEDEGHTWALRRHITNGKVGGTVGPDLMNDGVGELLKRDVVVNVDGRFCTQHAVNAERALAAMLTQIATTKSHFATGQQYTIAEGLSDKQMAAVEAAVNRKLVVITGGPGTGKSHATGEVARTLRDLGHKLVLMAPTGIASRRLSKACGMKATTVHRALGKSDDRPWHEHKAEELPATAVIIDEVSMIDVHMMEAVIRATPAHAKLILVGDVNQLPSIGPGAVLKDIIKSEASVVIRLTKIFRTKDGSKIPFFCRSVRKGESPDLKSKKGVRFATRNSSERIKQTLFTLMGDTLLKAQKGKGSRRSFDFDEIQVLVPQNVGPVGTKKLNVALQRIAKDLGLLSGPTAWVGGEGQAQRGDRVIQVRNNYDHEVFNGDIGFVEEVNFELGTADASGSRDHTRPVSVYFGERLIRFRARELKELQLAYALTIHKTQGSEFPCVLIPLHKSHRSMWRRRLLYTGASRAKELVAFIGDLAILDFAIQKDPDAKRRTRLRELLEAAWLTKE